MTDQEVLNSVLRITKKLISKRPFYGMILISLNKFVSRRIPTAGVGLQGLKYQLVINPDFWASLSEDHQTGLLIHEIKHICFFHPTDFKHLKNKNLANIAMDIYINQMIEPELLPEGGCTLEAFAEYNLEPNRDTNYYYNALLKAAQSQPQQGGGSGSGSDGDEDNDQQGDGSNGPLSDMMNGKSSTVGSDGKPVNKPKHEWDDIDKLSETEQQLLDRGFAASLAPIIENLQKSRGTIPFDVSQILAKLPEILPPKFNWRGFLRNFVGTSTKRYVFTTRRKKSNRFPDMPGQKWKEHSHILVGIDTSASVSNDELLEFMNEIHHMHRTGHDITLALADTRLHTVVKYKPNMDLEIKGRGGTDFQEVVDMYTKALHKYSCLIYLTDGECNAPKNARGNILWVMSSRSELNQDLPGKCIKLEL